MTRINNAIAPSNYIKLIDKHLVIAIFIRLSAIEENTMNEAVFVAGMTAIISIGLIVVGATATGFLLWYCEKRVGHV